MSNQEIFEMLSENEMNISYAHCRNPENDVLKAAHYAAKQALIEFAKLTGFHN